MAEVYVTLGEAAELERVKYNTMVKRVLRKQESFVTKTEKSENGGKDVVLVAVSSLSKQARNAWKEREKLKSFTEEFPDKKEDEQKPEVPWYVNTDVDWYIENYKERYYKAVELGNVVRKFLQYDEGDRTKYAEEFAQKYLGKGQRTLYRYTKAYLEASAWADKLEKEDGAGREFFKVLCLCRKPKETGCFPSIKPEVKQVIKNIWFNEDFARNQGTREMLYEKLTAIANINKWEKIPSYQTVTRYISYLMEDEGMRNAWFLASRGTREYKNKVMVKGSRDTKGLQVMQIVMGDEHTFDCWVSYKQPNGKVIAIKPHLAAWVDMRSRVIMGDVMCKDANSDILKQSLLKMIYSEPGGVPEYLYIDNGKDYTAKTMTGRDRNDRSGMNFDNETMGFYKSIGIKDDHRALPYEPWSKGQIERFFRTVCNKFTRWMKSYTGTLTGSKTSDKVDKDIKRMLERGELLTLEEFYEKWHEWLTTVYMHTEHSGLKKMGETYKKPYDCFMNEDRYFKAAPPKSYATMLMMKSENVLVRNIGITKWGYEYRSDELCDYIGRKVDIKYDPDDMAVLYVFDQKGKRICEAYCQELLQIAPKVTQKALEEHLKMQKRQQKRDRERLEEARRPFEELNEQYVGFNETTVLLAVRTLGYTSPVLVRANDLTGFSHFTLDGSWLLDGSRTLESDTIENRWAEFYIVIVMDADEEHPISFDIMRKTVRKWKEVGAKDNYFFKYNLSIRQPHTGNFLEVLYKKHLFYYDYRKLDGMWKLDGSYMLDAEMTPVGTRIGYRYESLYELHEAGLAVMAYNYACRMVESAILKAAYSFRMYYFEYLKTDGSWITDGSHVVDAEMSPREMRWSTTFHHQHEEELLLKQRYRMQPCEEEYSIRKTLERYRMVIDYFDYLKLNGLWKLTGSRLMDAQRTEYTTKQAYSFGVEHTREFRVIWHEEHNLIFLDGTWSLDGSKIIDAWQKTEVL